MLASPSLAGSISTLAHIHKYETSSSDEATRIGSVFSDGEATSDASPRSGTSDTDTLSRRSIGSDQISITPASSSNHSKQRPSAYQAESTAPVTEDGNPKIPVLCIYHARGRCTNDQSCRFSHGDEELAQVVASISEDRSKAKKTKLCRFHAIGRCLSGPNCLFAHGDDELRGGAVQARPASQGSSGKQTIEKGSETPVARRAAMGMPAPPTASVVSLPTMLAPSEKKYARNEAASATREAPAPPAPQTRAPSAAPATAPPTAPPSAPPRASPTSMSFVPQPLLSATITVPPIAPPTASPHAFLQKALAVARGDSDDDHNLSNMSTKASVSNLDENSAEEVSSDGWLDEQVATEPSSEQILAGTDLSPLLLPAPLEVVKVERWDDVLCRWVEDFIEIEEPPSRPFQVDLFDTLETLREEQQEPPPQVQRSRVCLEDLVQQVGVPRNSWSNTDVDNMNGAVAHSKGLWIQGDVEASRCSSRATQTGNVCESRSRASNAPAPFSKMSWYNRTPLRSSAAKFVPEGQSVTPMLSAETQALNVTSLRASAASFVPECSNTSLRSSAAMFVPEGPQQRQKRYSSCPFQGQSDW